LIGKNQLKKTIIDFNKVYFITKKNNISLNIKPNLMKNPVQFIIFILLFSTISGFAKDIKLAITNQTVANIDLYAGTINPDKNNLEDDEIVLQRNELNIKKLGRTIKAGKGGQATLKEAPGGDLVIVFGMYPGGGRTELFRYRVKDIKETLAITFEDVKLYRPTKSYIGLIKKLVEVNNTGLPAEVGDIEIVGHFLFYNINHHKKDSVFVFESSAEVSKSV